MAARPSFIPGAARSERYFLADSHWLKFLTPSEVRPIEKTEMGVSAQGPLVGAELERCGRGCALKARPRGEAREGRRQRVRRGGDGSGLESMNNAYTHRVRMHHLGKSCDARGNEQTATPDMLEPRAARDPKTTLLQGHVRFRPLSRVTAMGLPEACGYACLQPGRHEPSSLTPLLPLAKYLLDPVISLWFWP